MLLAIFSEERNKKDSYCDDRLLRNHDTKDGLCSDCNCADNTGDRSFPVLHNLTSNDGKNVRRNQDYDPRLQLDFFVREDRALGECQLPKLVDLFARLWYRLSVATVEGSPDVATYSRRPCDLHFVRSTGFGTHDLQVAFVSSRV